MLFSYHPYLAFSLDDFFKGVSKPINKKLFSIIKTCGFGEESGHGVPTVVKQYGKKAYYISKSHINVVIPFDDDLMAEVDKKNTP